MTTTDALVYDPYAYGIHDDPYPTYARLRDEAPVYRNDEGGFWALSRHADVVEAFRDNVRYSSAHGVSIDPAASGPDAHRTMSFLAMDPPMHGRMRGLVSRGFTPRRVAELEPRIRELTRQHLDHALEQGSFDFIGDIAGKLPMDVISELIGVPSADRDEVRRLSDLLVHREEGNNDVPPAGVEAAFSLIAYYSDMLSQRRATPTDDLTSALLATEVDGDRLTDDEIMGFLFLMVVAGNETTTKLLGNAWYWAWRHPGERAKPFADPSRVPDWVEETLRFDTSTQTATCSGSPKGIARWSGLCQAQYQALPSSLVVVSLPATTIRNRKPMISSSVRRSPSISASSSAEVRSSVRRSRRWASMSP